MPAIQTLHANFNGGLMTPRLGARFDLEKIRTGAVQLENMIPTPFGGVVKRPGLIVETWLGNGSRPRVITFKRSNEESNVIFLGPGWGKSYVDHGTASVAWVTGTEYLLGDVIDDSGDFYYAIQNHTAGATFAGDSAYWYKLTDRITGTNFGTNTSVDFPSPYTGTTHEGVKFEQANDVMFMAHPDYYPYRLTFRGANYVRYVNSVAVAGGNWVMEPVPFQFAPYLDLNESRIALQVQYDGIRKWADSWVVSTAYEAGDIIQGTGATAGRIYECILNHTSSASDQPGVGAATALYWTQLATGYVVGDRVLAISGTYEGQIFTCHTAHGGATADAVDEPGVGSAWASYWNLGTSSVNIATWTAGNAYTQGHKVRVNNVIYECKVSHTATNPRYNKYGNTGGNKPGSGQTWTTYWKISSAGNDLSGLEFKLVATEDMFASGDVGSNLLMEIGMTGRYETFSTSSGSTISPTEPLFIQGGFLVTTIWASGSAMVGVIYLEESLDGVTWSKIKEWNQTSSNDGNISYEGDAPDVGAWYRIGAIRTSGGSGPAKIEAVNSTVRLPFLIQSYVSETEVGGKLIVVGDQLPPASAIGVATTNYRKPAFSSTEGYPRAVCFHDGRLWWGGTTKRQARIWGSKLDDFYNFLTGSNDDSGLDITLGSLEANDIIWMVSHNRAMIVGTSGQEWTIDGGDAEAVITPTKIRARARTRYGSFNISPQPIAESLLFFTRRGTQLREFVYNFQIDGFTAPDMTQLLGGINSDSGVRSMAYTSTPFPILWVVDIRGNLWIFVYDREQNITAWSKVPRKTGEVFSSVAAMKDDALNIEYPMFIMQKTVAGVNHRVAASLNIQAIPWMLSDDDANLGTVVELYGRLDNAAPFNKSFLTLAGGNTTTPSSADTEHLRGRTVVAYDGLTYSSGTTWNPAGTTFTGWQPASSQTQVLIGELIDAKMQSFPLDVMLKDGTGQGRHWRPNRCQFILHKSQFGTYATDPDGTFYPISYPVSTVYSGRVEVHTAGDFVDATEFTIRHNEPGPFCVLGYVLKSEVSGS